jgi:hypothetical protein
MAASTCRAPAPGTYCNLAVPGGPITIAGSPKAGHMGQRPDIVVPQPPAVSAGRAPQEAVAARPGGSTFIDSSSLRAALAKNSAARRAHGRRPMSPAAGCLMVAVGRRWPGPADRRSRRAGRRQQPAARRTPAAAVRQRQRRRAAPGAGQGAGHRRDRVGVSADLDREPDRISGPVQVGQERGQRGRDRLQRRHPEADGGRHVTGRRGRAEAALLHRLDHPHPHVQ